MSARSCASAAWRSATACSSTARALGDRGARPRGDPVDSGRKPRLHALDGVPGVRGVARLAEAFALMPLVKRALPRGAAALRGRGMIAVAAGRDRGGSVRRRARGVGRRGGCRRDLARPRALALRGCDTRRLPRGRAQGDRRLRAGHRRAPRRRRSTIAAAPTSSRRCCSRRSRATSSCARSSRRAARWPAPRVALGSVALSVEVFAWSERHAGRAARARVPPARLRDAAPVRDARADEPSSSRSGRAAMAEILRLETARLAPD